MVLLAGPWVDGEAPGVAAGATGRTSEGLLRDELAERLRAWRARMGPGEPHTHGAG